MTRNLGTSRELLKSDSLCALQSNSGIESTYMHRKMKVLIARWLASRIETRTRSLRRALRDHQRAELRCIRAVIAAPAACGSTPRGRTLIYSFERWRKPVARSSQKERSHAAWLGETDDGNLKALLVPYPADQMRMWEISPRVNRPKNDDPSLWEPVHPQATQTTPAALELLRE